MISTLEELMDELQTGRCREHRHGNLELKQSWSQEVGKDISALCNKSAIDVGWVVIGVTDTGALSGQSEHWAKSTEQQVGGHLHQYLDPFQACQHIETRAIGTHWIVILQVGSPGSVVYWNSKAYKAAGTHSKEMEPDETLGLTLSLPGLQDYSGQEWQERSVDGQAIQQMATRISRRNRSGIFADLHAVSPESVTHRLGIRARQVLRILFSDVGYRLAVYDGAGNPTRNERVKPLYRIFDQQLLDEIGRCTGNAPLNGAPAYPVAAFQEAVANAVAHAAYFESDGDVMIEVFPNRVCISNLCTRESTHFANRWFSRAHFSINKLLMETLRLAGHVDELGRGKSVIFGEYIASGREAPSVAVERTGRYSRWRLTLPGSAGSERHLRMLEKLRVHYEGDELKARIGLALVLWRNRPVEEIRRYVDGEYAPLFAEVLSDMYGATFYFKDGDKIVLNRWARLLLFEGVDSKALTPEEDSHLFRLAHGICLEYHNGIITPAQIRKWAELGNGHGAETLSSRILKKWKEEGRIERIQPGRYRFVSKSEGQSTYSEILELFSKK